MHELRKYLTVVNVRRRGRNGVNDAGLCVDADVHFHQFDQEYGRRARPRDASDQEGQPVVLRDLTDRRTGLSLPERVSDLLIAEAGLFHGEPPVD